MTSNIWPQQKKTAGSLLRVLLAMMNISKCLWSTLVIQKVHHQGLGTTSQLAWLVRRSTHITLCGHLPVFSPCLLKDHPWKSESWEYCGRCQLTESSLCDTWHFESQIEFAQSMLMLFHFLCWLYGMFDPRFLPHLLSCQGPLSHVWWKDLDWCLLSWARKTNRKRQSKIWCSTKRCYKMPKDHVPEEAAINMSKSLHHFSEDFTISSTSWPHTGACPSWCCSAASMGGFNSLTR